MNEPRILLPLDSSSHYWVNLSDEVSQRKGHWWSSSGAFPKDWFAARQEILAHYGATLGIDGGHFVIDFDTQQNRTMFILKYGGA